jgi:ATP-dependent helicase HrpA
MKLNPVVRHTEPDAVHRALLSGLLTNIGNKGDRYEYKGTRGSSYSIIPGSSVFEEKPEWVMAGEVVRTTKVYARTVAKINPKWVEDAAQHLIKRTHSNPRWDSRTSRVVADERVALYGLDIIPRRTVHFGPIEPVAAREMFIHNALVEGDMRTKCTTVKRNRQLLANLRTVEDKARRGDLIADHQAIFKFYDERLPPEIYSGQKFERWARDHGAELEMTEADLVLSEDAKVTGQTHPDSVVVGSRNAGLSYRFMPGEEIDGVSVRVRVEDLPHLSREVLEWSVPGYIQERIESLIRSLPKQYRRQFDAPTLAEELTPTFKREDGSIESQLAAVLSNRAGVNIRPEQFRRDQVPSYLSPRIVVLDHDGKELASGRDLKPLKDQFKEHAHRVIDEAAGDFQRDGLTDWDMEEFPETIDLEEHGRKILGYPTMVIANDVVNLRVRTSRWIAEQQTRSAQGLLLGFGVKKENKTRAPQLPGYSPMAVNASVLGWSRQHTESVLLARAGMQLGVDGQAVIRDRVEFERRLSAAWADGVQTVQQTISNLAQVLSGVLQAQSRITGSHPQAWDESILDIRTQLELLLYEQWEFLTPTRWLWCYPRYCRAIEIRMDRIRNIGPQRDQQMIRTVLPWVKCLQELRDQGAHQDDAVAQAYQDLFWMVQEYRVAAFAQELRTAMPVSDKRLRAQLDKIIGG